MIVEKEVLKPHDCRELIVEHERARLREDRPLLWFGSILKCPICDARWEKREHQRDGVYWVLIVEGIPNAGLRPGGPVHGNGGPAGLTPVETIKEMLLQPGGPVRPLRYPQLPASDKRNHPRWFDCESDICSAFGDHVIGCTSKLNSDGKVV